jgi:hypothetical protein
MSGYPTKKNLNPNSPTNKWAKSILEDEMAGMKTMKIKLSTYKAITEISTWKEAATFDDIICAALCSYKRENENNGYDPLSAIVTTNDQEY